MDESVMREEKEPAIHGRDGDDESFDDVRVEPIAPGEQASRGVNQHTPAPDWTKRISTRGKLARALIATLAVIVVLIVVLPRTSFTLPPQVTRLLTPAPTQTPTPGHFTAGEFEQIPLPAVPNATPYAVVPSPRDPSTAYACMNPAQSASGGDPTSGEISLWVTHDAGHTWSRAPLRDAIGTSCDVESAIDGSYRVTLAVPNSALDQNGQACAHGHFYLSEDDGATWRPIEHTSLAPEVSQYGECYLQATAKHLFLETWTSNNGDQGHSILERSDDGGQTWQRADHGLEGVGTQWFAQLLDSGGDSLVTLISRFDIPGQAQSDLWITRDAGATWRHVGPVAPTTPQVNNGIASLWTEAGKDGPQLCHCVYGVSYPYGGSPIAGQYIYRTTDFVHWAQLPPIPVKGTSVQRSGVYQLLGIIADGSLLALGASPQEGVPALPDHNGRVSGAAPALWAWNIRSGRWNVAPTHIPCQDLQTCYMYATGVSVAAGASGAPRGTYIWIIAQVNTDQNGPATPAYYRVYIPAA
jgi:hypothetical protein